jgi:hypothetical protein
LFLESFPVTVGGLFSAIDASLFVKKIRYETLKIKKKGQILNLSFQIKAKNTISYCH